MAAGQPIYSQRLWFQGGSPPGLYTSDLPSQYRVFVVRNIDISATQTAVGYLNGFLFTLAAGGALWQMGPGATQPSRSYHWRGRAVLYLGEQLSLQTFDSGWSWTVSGYAFL